MTDIKSRIEQANRDVLEIYTGARPMLVDVQPAIDVLPGMRRNLILHSAPSIAWQDMCGPHRNGVIGAALWEGLAKDRDEAVRMLDGGQIEVAPCHHYATVGAGAGITSASTPMLVVDNPSHGNRAYSCLSEGGGLQLLKWGWYDETVARHLRWQADVLGPALGAALRSSGGIDIKAIIARAVQMGDECHNRSIAATSLFFRETIIPLIHTCAQADTLSACVDFLTAADQFFLHGVMAACKAALDPAIGVEYSTVVTAMARNGVQFGVRVAGLGEQWFTAPANHVEGLFFRSQWGPDDAAPDLGDSCITETWGLGGFIQAAAPTVQQYVRGNLQQAIANTREMREICIGTHADFQIPNMDFSGAPLGIDIRRVVRSGITPLIDTAITHKHGGLIGAGQVRAPMSCFEQALRAFSQRYLAR
ncbi:MAG: DUF1116 domain-containing protein [Pseudomonas sp.]